MWKKFDGCLQLHSADGVELVALLFSNPAFSEFQGMPLGWGEHTQVFLSLIFRKECGLSASPSKQREIKSVVETSLYTARVTIRRNMGPV